MRHTRRLAGGRSETAFGPLRRTPCGQHTAPVRTVALLSAPMIPVKPRPPDNILGLCEKRSALMRMSYSRGEARSPGEDKWAHAGALAGHLPVASSPAIAGQPGKQGLRVQCTRCGARETCMPNHGLKSVWHENMPTFPCRQLAWLNQAANRDICCWLCARQQGRAAHSASASSAAAPLPCTEAASSSGKGGHAAGEHEVLHVIRKATGMHRGGTGCNMWTAVAGWRRRRRRQDQLRAARHCGSGAGALTAFIAEHRSSSCLAHCARCSGRGAALHEQCQLALQVEQRR